MEGYIRGEDLQIYFRVHLCHGWGPPLYIDTRSLSFSWQMSIWFEVQTFSSSLGKLLVSVISCVEVSSLAVSSLEQLATWPPLLLSAPLNARSWSVSSARGLSYLCFVSVTLRLHVHPLVWWLVATNCNLPYTTCPLACSMCVVNWFTANYSARFFLVLSPAECKSILVGFHYVETLTLKFLNTVTP